MSHSRYNMGPAARKLRAEMVRFLKSWGRGMVDDGIEAKFDREEAIYWFASNHHSGSGSPLYEILSSSEYKSGPIVKGPEEGSVGQMMYEALEQQFGKRKNPGVRKNIFAFNNKPGARRNIFAFNNPGPQQVWLAEKFVKGATSGVESSLYIHGATIYSYGPHFPVARREGDLILITTKKAPSKTTAGHINLVKKVAQQSGKEIAYQDLPPEGSGPAAFSNPRSSARKNIFAFNNGRRPVENQMERAAREVGLYVATWAPGDGQTRYRFFTKSSSYDEGDGIYTALGRGDAMNFIRAYGLGRGTKSNPYARGRERRSFQEYLARKRTEYGAKFDPSDLDPRFIPYYENGKRIWVDEFSIGESAKSGTVGVTTGWKPTFLLISSSRAMGSSTLLTKKTKILGEVGLYKPRRGEYGQPIPNGSVNTFKVKRGMEGRVASLLRNMFIWAKAQDGEVMTLAKPSIAKKVIAHIEKGGAGWTRENPLTLAETRELEHEARSARITGEGIQGSPGSRGYHIGRSEGMREVIRRHGSYARKNPLTMRESRSILSEARQTARAGGNFQRGHTRSSYTGIALGKAGVVRDHGPKRMSGAAERVSRRAAEIGVRQNPLLQTILLANPPIEAQWADMSKRKRATLLGFIGYPDDYAPVIAARSWMLLPPRARQALVAAWQDSGGKRSGGTTIRRPAPVMANPGGVRVPFRDGQRIPIETARAWIKRIGNVELLRQFEEAERLQIKANRRAKFVIWKNLPIGSPKKIEMLTAFAHYGDSPETMYRPPKGSKKGRHMYRHEWGDGTGRSKPVPVLAAPGGKAIITVMGSGQKTGDWMRG